MKKYITIAFACLSQLWGGSSYKLDLETSKIFQWVDNPDGATVLDTKAITSPLD